MKGVVQEKHSQRSYTVKTEENKTLQRNRRALRKTNELFTEDNTMDLTAIYISQQILQMQVIPSVYLLFIYNTRHYTEKKIKHS